MAATVTRDDLVSPDYQKTLKLNHAVHPGWGRYGRDSVNDVAAYADDLGATTILDFGCGTGTLAPALCGRDVREYDPGIDGKDALPEEADLVVATDVLEHIEPDRLDATLAFIRRLARRGAFFVIATTLAKEVLPDGRNAHLVVRPTQWWRERLTKAGFRVMREQRRKGYTVWCK